VSTIINFHKRLRQTGGRVVILQPGTNIKEVFSITGVGEGIRLYDFPGAFEKEVHEGKL
jgi:anti-anti-sigma regulatory factor